MTEHEAAEGQHFRLLVIYGQDALVTSVAIEPAAPMPYSMHPDCGDHPGSPSGGQS